VTAPLRSPAQVRVAEADLDPVEVHSPELLAPLARAIHNGKCPVCEAPVHGVEDIVEEGRPRVQISCFGDPAHVFFFEAHTGHIANQPSRFGRLRA
jgi:hypothetical protein